MYTFQSLQQRMLTGAKRTIANEDDNVTTRNTIRIPDIIRGTRIAGYGSRFAIMYKIDEKMKTKAHPSRFRASQERTTSAVGVHAQRTYNMQMWVEYIIISDAGWRECIWRPAPSKKSATARMHRKRMQEHENILRLRPFITWHRHHRS